MKPDRCRPLFLAVCVAGVAMVGCSSQPSTTTAPPAHAKAASSTAKVSPRPTAAPNRPSAAPSRATAAPKPVEPSLPSSTGIPACDDYLASYVACHRAANIFPPDQVEPRYQTMRDTLLRDSEDPTARPQLQARCTSLSSTLREALHGKSCTSVEPIPAVSTSSSP